MAIVVNSIAFVQNIYIFCTTKNPKPILIAWLAATTILILFNIGTVIKNYNKLKKEP